jgi:glycosyltransferase involved in cell wall biosynthesis
VIGRSDQIWLLDHGMIAGGGQRFGLRLAQALMDRGARVTIGCNPGNPLVDWCADAGIEVTKMRFPAPAPTSLPAVPTALARTRRLLHDVGEQSIVIGNHPRAHAYLFAATRGLRSHPAIVNLVHEQESAARRSLRYAYKHCGSLLVTGSNATATYGRWLPDVPLAKVNNFLLPESFAREKASPSNAARVIGVLARMIPEKGIVELIDELAAEDVRPCWRELRVGAPFQDSSYTRLVEQRISEHGLEAQIRLLGEVSDVPTFLSSLDLLVVPSVGNETQPTVILEALAAGLPVAVRSPLFDPEFEGLPVAAYSDSGELRRAISKRPSPARTEDLRRRFGPEQAIAGLETAAQLARAR